MTFAVEDSGIGIDKKQLSNLFQSFTQADLSTTREFGGSGLGLAICKQLVELMGGTIHAQSELGRGSRFAFELPLKVRSVAKTRETKRLNELRGLRALVVDDNGAAREIMSNMLNGFGIEVVNCESGAGALRELERAAQPGVGRPYDIVLMDWQMPGMDGIETAEQLRRIPILPQIPTVIMVTSFGREEVMKRAKRAELDGFLIKPVSPSLMLDTLVNIFHRTDFKPGMSDNQGEQDRILLQGEVLVVEDNDINRQIAREILQGLGLTVTEAENGKVALDKLEGCHFDLILMDVQMPEMDGIEATKRIRNDLRNTEVPIIAMTAHALPSDRAQCEAAGMNDYLSKPIEAEQWNSVIANHLGEASRMHRIADGRQEATARGLFDGLEGINVAEGLARVGNNAELYAKLLCECSASYQGLYDQVRDLVDRDDRDAAGRLLHSIKGVAGNIGAKRLYETVRDMEAALHERDSERLADDLPTLRSALEEILDSLGEKTTKAPHPVAAADDAVAGIQDLPQLIDDLDALLDAGDVRAVEAAQSLRPLETNPAAAEIVARLLMLIDDYEYPDARQCLSPPCFCAWSCHGAAS